MADQQGLQQKRIDDLQGRVRKLDAELVKYREQLKKTRPGTSAHNSVKRRSPSPHLRRALRRIVAKLIKVALEAATK